MRARIFTSAACAGPARAGGATARDEDAELVLSFLGVRVDEDEAEPPLVDRSMGGSSFGVCNDTSIEVLAPRVERV